jgi:hypothetical protein
MSNTENKPFFGQIGKRAVLGWRDTYGSYSLRQRRWRCLSPSDLQKVTPLTRRSFLRRYGRKITSLPDWFAITFVPLTVIGERGLAGICRTASTRFFQRCPSAGCSGDVIPFEPFYRERERQSRTFYLGYHEYSAGPGAFWSCEYKVVRLDGDGRLWEILSTTDESGHFESMGSFSVCEAKEYFDSVYFRLSDDDWCNMGAKKLPDEETSDEDGASYETDDYCAICQRPLSFPTDSLVHKCHPDYQPNP